MTKTNTLTDEELFHLAGYSGQCVVEQNDGASPDSNPTIIQAPLGYVSLFNWALMKYVFISTSIRAVLGYDRSVFLERGIRFFSGIVHPDDSVMLRELYRCIFKYYYSTAPHKRARLRFSYNLRVKAADGTFIQILRQSIFSEAGKDGKPAMEFITSTDITAFRYKRNITLTVHCLSEKGVYSLCYQTELAEAVAGLTDRERQVLDLIREGLTTRRIADLLHLSVETVKSHRKHIIAKTDALNMASVVSKVYERA